MASPIDLAKPEFEQVIEHLKKELNGVRSGRASASMVEGLPVEAYGSMMELKGLAAISTPDARTVQIEPWDKTVVANIEKAILASGLGLNPNTAGTVIRLVIPPMTEENRKNLVKLVHQKAEQARIGLRGVRESVRDGVNKKESAKEIGEDEKFRMLEQLDKAVAEWNAKVEQLAAEKEKDILTI